MVTKYEKANRSKLLAAVMIMAVVLAGATVVISDSGVDAADTTYISGDVTSTQNFGDDTNVVVNGNLTIPDGMALIISGTGKLTVNEGYTITIKAGGQLIFQQNISGGVTYNPTVKINGNIVAEGTDTATPEDTSYVGAIVNNTTIIDKTGVFVGGNITLQKGAELTTGSGTIGTNTITATSGNGEILVNNGGSIDVTKRSSSISKIESQTVILNQGAKFTTNGSVDDVVVKATGSGTYYTGGAIAIDGGTTPDDRKTSNLTFTVSIENMAALRTAGDNSSITLRQYVLNVDGTLSNGDKLSTIAGTSVDGSEQDANFFETTGMEYQIVPKVSISGSLTVDSDSSIVVKTYTHVDVSGTLTIKYDSSTTTSAPTKAVSTINGTVHVTGNMAANSKSITIINGGSGNKADYVKENGESDKSVTYYNTLKGLNKFIVDGGVVEITDVEGDFIDTFGAQHVYGSAYFVEGTSNTADKVYIMDFAAAIEQAVAAEAPEVYVFAWGAQNRTSSEDAIYNGAAVVEGQMTIPDGLAIIVYNALVIADGATLVLEEGAEVIIAEGENSTASTIKNGAKNAACVWVEGKVVDYYGAMADYEGKYAEFIADFADESVKSERALFAYEVKKTAETETDTIVTYTTLKTALSEAQADEEIQLNGSVKVDENLTIPAGVTVITDGESGTVLTIESATLTVNGILEITGNGGVALTTASGKTSAGAVIVNNIIRNADATTFNATVPGAYFSGKIGDDEDGTKYITSATVAGENSATTSDITLQGRLSMGDVTFTQGENETTLTITVNGEVSAGVITLVGTSIEFCTTGTGASFTGSLSSAVTVGTSSIDFNKTSGITISVDGSDDGETITTVMKITGDLKGNATVTAGSVTVESLSVGNYDGASDSTSVLTVASGATLNVDSNSALAVVEITSDKAFAGLVVDGTFAIDGGAFTLTGQADINGTMTVKDVNQTIAGTLIVTGTLTVSEEENSAATVTISGKVILGTVPTSVGATASITGPVEFDGTGSLLAYDGTSDLIGAKLDWNVTENKSDAISTEYYVNGSLFAVAYTGYGMTVDALSMISELDVAGYDKEENVKWFNSAEADGTALTSANIGEKDETKLYTKLTISTTTIVVSPGPGLEVYIDDLKITDDSKILNVGEHTVTVYVKSGYEGTPVITFNGQTITDGKIVITADTEDGSKLVVTGATPIDYSQGGSSDNGMGLVEILLIVLVVMVVILAIVVILRMMRS